MLLRRLGDLIAENQEQLAQLESRDNGKLIRETRGQVGYLPEFFHYTAGLADKLEGGVKSKGGHRKVPKASVLKWIEAAKAAAGDKDYRKAADYYRKALAIKPDMADAKRYLALAEQNKP